MKILIAGGTGFIGEPLVQRLVARGDDVAVLTRNPAKVTVGRGLRWDGRTQGDWSAEAATADAVVNLAGENVGEGRWTEERKRKLIGSRLDATRAIVDALRREPNRERALINASGVSIYGDRGDEPLDESASRGKGFLADLADRWETAAREAEPLARLIILRIAVVLAPKGGALKKMLLPFKLGLGGPIGSGKQWMSWIAREDLLRMIEWAIDDRNARGIYNATSPEPVPNRRFVRALGRALHRPAFMPAPAFALRLAFGQMAEEALLSGQRVVPRRAESEGFRFQHPQIEDALSQMFAT